MEEREAVDPFSGLVARCASCGNVIELPLELNANVVVQWAEKTDWTIGPFCIDCFARVPAKVERFIQELTEQDEGRRT